MSTVPPEVPRVRRAEVADAAALARLRELMLREMGRSDGEDTAWLAVAEEWFARRLRARRDFAAFVMDDPELGVVSGAVGACREYAPEPGDLTELRGHVSNISTDPRRRGRGHARACLNALLTWFRDETGVQVLDLNATEHGMGLYLSAGFAPPRYPALQLRVERHALDHGIQVY
ncbi:GNAT family N-acetyltransferase [Actinoallomurus acaciae]|uniref:GNAT family N-acetyltransferase n=1 Tax=Actinoallomurus acaciae TaxID=502577 RepID=A0ABV5YDP4_9ACTN